jgi:signal recognition particle subunit SRP9
MYLETIESFLVQAEDLYRSNPLKTRYSIKYRHCDGKLVVKVTDDVTVRVVLFKTTRSFFLG